MHMTAIWLGLLGTVLVSSAKIMLPEHAAIIQCAHGQVLLDAFQRELEESGRLKVFKSMSNHIWYILRLAINKLQRTKTTSQISPPLVLLKAFLYSCYL